MTLLADRRIDLVPAPPRAAAAALETVFVGHCPGEHRPRALTAEAIEALGAAGLVRLAAAMRRLLAGEPVLPHADAEIHRRLDQGDLHQLPLVFHSWGAFRAVFPQASTVAPLHPRPLCGVGSWLARAVEDFFQAGGERCWVVAVPEADGAAGFLPGSPATVQAHLLQPELLRGAELVGVLPEAALLAMPDLERLALPVTLIDPGAVDPVPVPPEFQPCGRGDAPSFQARRGPMEDPAPSADVVLTRVATLLARFRPDMQWLHLLPIAARLGTEVLGLPSTSLAPSIAPAAMSGLARLAADPQLARAVQPLWPCLREPGGGLRSPVGLIAGAIAASARTSGVWRSIAGQRLPAVARPFPAIDALGAAELREAHHVGVLTTPTGLLELDDERCASAACAHSAEVARFIGWIRRRLQRLGERLVFVADPRDPAVLLTVEHDLDRLHRAGALAGGPGRPAYRVQRGRGGPGELVIDIELRPTLPIDLIRVTLAGREGRWAVEEARRG